ncbi:unnamed protein product [Withania somnifera]
MANLTLHFLLIFLFVHCIIATNTESVTSQNSNITNFIIISCKTTLYPTICKQLAHAALLVSLSKAKIASTYISKLTKMRGLRARESQAAKDCSFTMNDSLGQSGKLASSRRDEFTWHVSNVQTWISAALTDENTCLDMINNPSMDAKVRDSIRVRVLIASQVTSNALALVYQFAERPS